jgi:hypothetical protein
MSEVPLYDPAVGIFVLAVVLSATRAQSIFENKSAPTGVPRSYETPTPLGSYRRPLPRVLGGS